MKNLKSAVLTISLCFASFSAHGIAVYSYVGNNFGSFVDETTPSGTFTTSDFVTVSFTVATAFAPNSPLFPLITPLSFSMSDGRSTLTDTTPNVFIGAGWQVATNSSGDIINWDIHAHNREFLPQVAGDQSASIGTRDIGSTTTSDAGTLDECISASTGTGGLLDCTVSQSDQGLIFRNPGTWTMSTTDDPIPAVPVPAAFWLFGTALIGLVGFSKRRKAV